MPAPIRVAIIGMGMSTTVFHAPFILANSDKYTLSVIVERSATSEKSKARDAYPGVKVVNTLEEALKEDIEAVWILSINSTHYDFAKQVLNAGKHVIVEKPVTSTAAEAEELAALAQEKNLVLAVYQNRRFDADFLTVKKLLAEGTFGELSEFTSHFDRYKNVLNAKTWKEDAALPGSGATYDLGSHLIDQILDLFGPPKRVTGIVRNSRALGSPDVPDSFLIHLHYDATSTPGRQLPLIATARGSILSLITPQPRYMIRGTNASFTKTGVDVQEPQLIKDGAAAISKPGYAVEPKEQHGVLYRLEDPTKPETIVSEKGNYGAWFENVAEALSANDPSKLIVKPEQAALTIRIIELAEQSSREGRSIDL